MGVRTPTSNIEVGSASADGILRGGAASGFGGGGVVRVRGFIPVHEARFRVRDAAQSRSLPKARAGPLPRR
jgi:hypothetical protein